MKKDLLNLWRGGGVEPIGGGSVARIIAAILLGILFAGSGAAAWAAPIGFQGRRAQFPYATYRGGIGFQGQYGNPNRFFVDPSVAGPGFQPTPGTFPLEQDPRFPTWDPRFDPTPAGFNPQQSF